MKRIEEFTAEELRTVYHSVPSRYIGEGWRAVLDYIKANLDTGKASEPMSVEKIEEAVQAGFMKQVASHGTMTLSKAIAEEIQPLTVQQGFVVDWSKAPEYANSVKWHWSHDADGENVISTRPSPNMRQKTKEEKVDALSQWIDWGYEVDSMLNGRALALAKCTDATIDDLCRAAGIPLETEE